MWQDYVPNAIFLCLLIVLFYIIGDRRSQRLSKKNRQYAAAVDRYVKVEGAMFEHIREHVLRDEDLTWAVKMPLFVTIGIKDDGTVMSDSEWQEAMAEKIESA